MSWRIENGVYSRVVSQGPCDSGKCNSSDAKTLYDDGHSYCFSCHTRWAGEYKKKVPEMLVGRPPVKEKPSVFPTRMEIDTYNCPKNFEWLKRHMLTDDEMDKWFFYAPVADRHVFAYHDGEEDSYHEARDVNGRIPKTLSYGTKPTIWIEDDKTDVLVVVEDLVSAIRVGRNYSCLPLFGSFLSSEQMAAIKERGHTSVIMWLDCDKYTVGMEYAKKMSMLAPTIAVQTLLDPKALPDDAIIHVVENALETLEAS